MKNIAVIGAGTMGNGIAHTFAQFDYKVQLIDISQSSLDKGMAQLPKTWTEWLLEKRLPKLKKNKHCQT
jgi:3-hydroxybutyryl-CoA dehydrogenase